MGGTRSGGGLGSLWVGTVVSPRGGKQKDPESGRAAGDGARSSCAPAAVSLQQWDALCPPWRSRGLSPRARTKRVPPLAGSPPQQSSAHRLRLWPRGSSRAPSSSSGSWEEEDSPPDLRAGPEEGHGPGRGQGEARPDEASAEWKSRPSKMLLPSPCGGALRGRRNTVDSEWGAPLAF